MESRIEINVLDRVLNVLDGIEARLSERPEDDIGVCSRVLDQLLPAEPNPPDAKPISREEFMRSLRVTANKRTLNPTCGVPRLTCSKSATTPTTNTYRGLDAQNKKCLTAASSVKSCNAVSRLLYGGMAVKKSGLNTLPPRG